MQMSSYLHTLRLPVLFAALNMLGSSWVNGALGEPIDSALFNIVRFCLFFLSGWLVISRKVGGLPAAALAGAILLFVDHVVVKGGKFLLEFEIQAFLGVLVSYVMFIWIALVIGFIGGFAARIWGNKSN